MRCFGRGGCNVMEKAFVGNMVDFVDITLTADRPLAHAAHKGLDLSSCPTD